MAKKKTILPKDFIQMLENGNVEELKKVYDTCDINAKSGRYGSNAFELSPLPRKFAIWLKEQGADVNKKDYYGNLPIFRHASDYKGDVRLLIELGADIHVSKEDGTTPLHLAATFGRIDAIKALIENGADVNAGMNGKILKDKSTPLEAMLMQARHRMSAETLVCICEILLENGAQITQTAREQAVKLGKDFEKLRKHVIPEENREKECAAMKHLYQIFEINPVEET